MPDMHDEEKVSELPIGLLINFRRRKLEYQRLHQSEVFESEEETVEPIPFWDTCFFYHAYQAYPLYHVFLSFAAKFWDFLGIYDQSIQFNLLFNSPLVLNDVDGPRKVEPLTTSVIPRAVYTTRGIK